MREFKAVLWDFGGVLTSSPFEAFNRFEAENSIPKGFYPHHQRRNPDDNAWAQFESSALDLGGFDEAFLAETTAAGHPIPGKTVISLLSGDLRPKMVAALKACKTHYQNACLTNNREASGQAWRATTRANAVGEVMALFDLVVESSIEGVRKPEPRAYELVLERLGGGAEAVLYLDDLGINQKSPPPPWA